MSEVFCLCGSWLDDVGEFGGFESAVEALALAGGELHFAGFGGNERIISGAENVGAGVDFRAALADDYHACANRFTFVFFDAETFGLRIAAATGGTTGLFMCHTEN